MNDTAYMFFVCIFVLLNTSVVFGYVTYVFFSKCPLTASRQTSVATAFFV